MASSSGIAFDQWKSIAETKTKEDIYALCDRPGFQLEARNEDNETALLVEVRNNAFDCVMGLLIKEANIHAIDKDGNGVLHNAVKVDSPDLLKLLIAFGADVEAINNNKETPLQEADRLNKPNKLQIMNYLASSSGRPKSGGAHEHTAMMPPNQRSASTGLTHLCQGAATERFLEGRVALVTGSTSGIGLGAARSLAARGCRVILTGFGDEQLIKSLQAEFAKDYHVKADYIPADLTKASDIENLCQQIKEIHTSGVDILLNNAGFQHVSKVEEFPIEKWDALIAVLLSAPFHLIRVLLPDMRRRGWGRIINLASTHSVRASPFKAGYVSAKHGLAGLTKVVALETAGSGITCNALSPGFVDTPILKMQVQALADKEKLTYDDAKAKFLSSFHPSKDAIGIDQLGEMCVFLCSDAASQITGSNIIMDGGWTAK